MLISKVKVTKWLKKVQTIESINISAFNTSTNRDGSFSYKIMVLLSH